MIDTFIINRWKTSKREGDDGSVNCGLTYIQNCEEVDVAPNGVDDGHIKDGLPHEVYKMNKGS